MRERCNQGTCEMTAADFGRNNLASKKESYRFNGELHNAFKRILIPIAFKIAFYHFS